MEQVNHLVIIIKRNQIVLGVRDYIHVVDVAIGHTAAMKKFEENCGFKVSIENIRIPDEFIVI